jgi:hypothetical protein
LAGGGSSNRPAARSIGSPARSNNCRRPRLKNDAAVLGKPHASGFLPDVCMPEVCGVWLVSATETRGLGLRVAPPSTTNTWPVMQRAWSESRKRTALPTSQPQPRLLRPYRR